MGMSWEHLAFIHWRIEPEAMRPLLPPCLELDTFDGSAWLGVVPFLMNRVRARCLPPFPGTHRFLEMNLRTYVRNRDRPGVWFFSLDATSWLAVRGARLGFHLPYFDARMSASFGDTVSYASRRTHARAIPGAFRADYRPTGPVFQSQPGTLEHWLTERYCLYAAKGDTLYRGEIHHLPWPLQPAEVSIRENSLGDLVGLDLSYPPESVLFSRRLDVVAWLVRQTALPTDGHRA